jgi:hypothetical protein
MKPRVLIALVFATLGAGGPIQPPTDYLLRVEFLGYDTEILDPPPREEFIRSIEILIRPGQPFLGRLKEGKETITVRGTFRCNKEGDFVGDLSAARLVDNGHTVPIAPGKEQKIFDITSGHATVSLKRNEPFQCGGVVSRSEEHLPDGTIHRRVRSHIIKVMLAEYDPAEDEAAAERVDQPRTLIQNH